MQSSFFMPCLDSSLKVYEHLKEQISYTQEEVWIVCLNSLKKALRTEKIFMGTVDQSLIHPRELLHPVIQSRSSSFILCHSHPSGDPSPSQADLRVTKRMHLISDLIEISLCDHIIFSQDKYFSFADARLEPFGRSHL